MLNSFKETMTTSTIDIIGLVNDTLGFGFPFEEAFPATSYVTFERKGKKYQLKMEVTVREIV